ncbi:MAG: hypothetical protein ACE5HE_06915 [Phycisphaerae bacterium]
MAWGPATTLARVELNVTRTGFPTIAGGCVVRAGEWVPILADLALVDQERAFDGVLQTAQVDGDGDEYFDSVDVHLRAETGGTQRLHLYVPAGARRGQLRFTLELRNAVGEAVEVVSEGELTFRPEYAGRPHCIPNDDAVLLLALSSGVVGRVGDLADASHQTAVYARPVYVAHLSPRELPEHWIGLEAVDYVVWDDARPDELTTRQLGALLEWIRQGGTLLIAASRSADSIRLTKAINAVLPVDLGETVAVDNLAQVRSAVVGPPRSADGVPMAADDWLDVGFPNAIPVVRCLLRPEAIEVARDDVVDSTVIARARLGRGYIIYSAVALRDLFSAPGVATDFFRNVFHWRRAEGDGQAPPLPVPLFAHVISAVSFSTSAETYLLIAGASSIVYALLATFGTWGFLRLRGGRHHSWSAFALTGLTASAVTMVVVNWFQGFGDVLHQISVIDADADSSLGRGTAFFGLKTSSDKEMDLWLPSSAISATEPGPTESFLRPLPGEAHRGGAGTSYVDPQEYRLMPASAVVDNVRIRATLKQFEARWTGRLDGRLTGHVNVERHRITDDSYVINALGVDLDQCYLLHALVGTDQTAGARDRHIYVYDIGLIPGNGLKTKLAPRCYQPRGSETLSDVMNRSTLAYWQREVWGGRFKGVLANIGLGQSLGSGVSQGNERSALLLLSTISDFDPVSVSSRLGQFGRPRAYSRDLLRQLDLREQLQPGSVILIGFANDPGPIRLFGRRGDHGYRPIKPDPRRSWTMFRIRVPTTEVQGEPVGGATEGS